VRAIGRTMVKPNAKTSEAKLAFSETNSGAISIRKKDVSKREFKIKSMIDSYNPMWRQPQPRVLHWLPL
jgi:hypothetical protein